MKCFKIAYRNCRLQMKHLCWSHFLIKLQALRPATLLKRGSNTGVSLWKLRIFKTAFSVEHFRWLLLCLLERQKEGSVEQRSEEKFFKWKKKIKTIHLTSTCKFWCWFKQKCKYNYVHIRTVHPLSLYFFFKFSFFSLLRVHLLCFHFSQTEKYLLLHLLVYLEAGIGSCSVKQLFGNM